MGVVSKNPISPQTFGVLDEIRKCLCAFTAGLDS